jgi:uncharacterized membrane protein YoaK (UPF0700 family)
MSALVPVSVAVAGGAAAAAVVAHRRATKAEATAALTYNLLILARGMLPGSTPADVARASSAARFTATLTDAYKKAGGVDPILLQPT